MTPECDRHRGCVRAGRERFGTIANQITFVRTAASVAVGLVGAYQQSLTLLLVALGIYWVGDMLDGAVARWTDTETRIGAVLDICCDRLCAGVFYIGLAWLMPEMALPIGVYLFSFVAIDTFLSLAFLAWPLTSPNYFFLVDRTIWAMNWSKTGKAVNSSAIAILMVVTGWVVPCTLIATALLGLKVWSLIRLARLGLPVPAGCAAEASAR